MRPLLVLTLSIALSACAGRQLRTGPPSGRLLMAALETGSQDLYVRIVDVGAGLCAVVRAPGNHFLVYDTGHWQGQHCVKAVREVVTAGTTIQMMVLSHSDADHLGDGARILKDRRVRHIVLAGEPRGTGTWSGLIGALAKEVKDGASVLNLQSLDFTPGTTFPLGEAKVTLMAGWREWTEAGPTESERRNAISVVVRVEYHGRSILFTGDTVGRRLGDADDACKDAEKVMVDRHLAGTLSLKSDVLVASHHGGNNGSAGCFIAAIDPQFVVFSSGHDHQHPTSAAAGRFLAHGLPSNRILRTDFGDDESGVFEWKVNSVPGCQDPAGDDDVEVALKGDGSLEVDYLRTAQGCDSRTGT